MAHRPQTRNSQQMKACEQPGRPQREQRVDRNTSASWARANQEQWLHDLKQRVDKIGLSTARTAALEDDHSREIGALHAQHRALATAVSELPVVFQVCQPNVLAAIAVTGGTACRRPCRNLPTARQRYRKTWHTHGSTFESGALRSTSWCAMCASSATKRCGGII